MKTSSHESVVEARKLLRTPPLESSDETASDSGSGVEHATDENGPFDEEDFWSTAAVGDVPAARDFGAKVQWRHRIPAKGELDGASDEESMAAEEDGYQADEEDESGEDVEDGAFEDDMEEDLEHEGGPEDIDDGNKTGMEHESDDNGTDANVHPADVGSDWKHPHWEPPPELGPGLSGLIMDWDDVNGEFLAPQLAALASTDNAIWRVNNMLAMAQRQLAAKPEIPVDAEDGDGEKHESVNSGADEVEDSEAQPAALSSSIEQELPISHPSLLDELSVSDYERMEEEEELQSDDARPIVYIPDFNSHLSNKPSTEVEQRARHYRSKIMVAQNGSPISTPASWSTDTEAHDLTLSDAGAADSDLPAEEAEIDDYEDLFQAASRARSLSLVSDAPTDPATARFREEQLKPFGVPPLPYDNGVNPGSEVRGSRWRRYVGICVCAVTMLGLIAGVSLATGLKPGYNLPETELEMLKQQREQHGRWWEDEHRDIIEVQKKSSAANDSGMTAATLVQSGAMAKKVEVSYAREERDWPQQGQRSRGLGGALLRAVGLRLRESGEKKG